MANTRTHITDLAITWSGPYDSLYVYIPGLSEDLFKEFKVVSSKGPSWQKEAIDQLEKAHDFHENSSYWYERYDVEKMCGFTQEESDNVYESYTLNWKAIKRIHGNQKSVMYIVEYVTTLETFGKTCDILEDEFVFLNAKDSHSQPKYLGELEDYLPQL